MNMIVNGTAIAKACAHSLRERMQARAYTLVVISIAPDFATTKYLGIKRRYAESIGVHMEVRELSMTATTEDVLGAIVSARNAEGIVLQLPFPPHIDTEHVLAALPAKQDVDVIGQEASERYYSGNHTLLPPVVGAIAEIATHYGVSFQDARVVVIGKGRLVGVPSATWARAQGAVVTVVDKHDDVAASLHDAHIVISGAGAPGLVTPEMLTQGVVIFDAGTSEDGGKLAGDVSPECVVKATVFTPVPGGIGPVAVAKLFENLYALASG
jgi:methylenetetrahydrofolate dehydrogenase (NADP+) / methenyltetrahydrofolate cyclohydrolase